MRISRQTAWRVLALFFWTLPGFVRGDLIVFENGRELEGVIRKETETHITVDLGVGAMTVDRTRIKSIERSDSVENSRLQMSWQEKYFLHRKHVPPGLEDIADSFRKLSAQRDDAASARRALLEVDAEERKVQREVAELRTRLVAVSERVASTSPEKDVEGYNALIVESNSLRALLTLTHDTMAKLRARRARSMEVVSDYLAALSAFDALFLARLERSREAGASEERAHFFSKISSRLATLSTELLQTSVETKLHGGSTIVSVLINDRVQGRFILDTGAAHVTISQALAERLALDTSTALPTEVRLADGRKVKAKSVTLRSVALGDARAEWVPATILPSSVSEDIDGLLGMSFLRHFVVRLDGASGKLVLRQFNPG